MAWARNLQEKWILCAVPPLPPPRYMIMWSLSQGKV